MGLRTLVLALALPLLAQQDDAPWRRMLESKKQVTAYLEREAQLITDRAAAELASAAAWEKLRPRRLEQMRDMLGLLPWPARTPLQVQNTGTLDKSAYTIEKIAFQSLPGIYVTGNLYLPKQRSRQLPAVLYVCGHAVSPYGDKTKYQRHGISFARNGYIAFILDSIQIAETFALHHGVHGQEMYDWYSRGYTPAGVEVWNAMRAIDYLETRPEVDPARIGMTGRSGGAAMSWFTAAVDPRVRVVAPVMGISTYAANLRENTQRLHCDCMFPINSWMHDMLHQGALIAPRPLLMMHGRKDALFPVAGYTEFEQRVGALYREYGRADGFGNVVVDTGHQDSDYLREQAIRWFDRHLMKIPERKLDMDYSEAPEESLAVFSGHPPSDARNYRVHETFTTAGPPQEYTQPAAWQSRQRELQGLLRSKVFAAFPTSPVEPRVRRQGGEIEFDSEPGIPIRALLRKPSNIQEPGPAVLYVASDGDDPEAIFSLLGSISRVRMAVYPRGVGEVPWDKIFWKATLRNAMHTGRTIDSMRLWDVLRSLDVLRAEPGVDPHRILVMGRGVSGALALYTALLDSRIHQVLLIDAPESHAQGPIFLNVMRYTDLPEAAALLAPRRLNFYGRMPPPYEYTRRIYALEGKPDHVFLSMNIAGVLEGRYHHDYSSGR
ncbi:MAG: acetylxylan esterase [Acidobacteria bacterium]|nr:acetylxylan esterase [Acidobacteriota bacterium]